MRDEKPEKIGAILHNNALTECQKIDQTIDILCGNYDKYQEFSQKLNRNVELFSNLIILSNQINEITQKFCSILKGRGNEQKKERNYRFNVREGVEESFIDLNEKMVRTIDLLETEVINDPVFYRELGLIRSSEVFDAVNKYSSKYHIGDAVRKVARKIKSFSKRKEMGRDEKLARIKFSAFQRYREGTIYWGDFKKEPKNASQKKRGKW
jgi:hypothetical protein